MSESIDSEITYKAFKLLYMNPDSQDVLEFLYVYDQLKAGRDVEELSEEIENNRDIHERAYPEGYKRK